MDIPELRRLLEEIIPKSTAVIDYEVKHDFPNIGRRTMLLSAHRLFHPDNNSRVLLLSIVDATERRKRESEQTLLLREIRHRMKNLLATVHAIAGQTSTEGRSGEAYRDAFLDRFNALMQAHERVWAFLFRIALSLLRVSCGRTARCARCPFWTCIRKALSASTRARRTTINLLGGPVLPS